MVFQEIDILVNPVVVDGISREDWYKTAEGRKVVLGEFSRMGQLLLMMEGRIAWDLYTIEVFLVLVFVADFSPEHFYTCSKCP